MDRILDSFTSTAMAYYEETPFFKSSQPWRLVIPTLLLLLSAYLALVHHLRFRALHALERKYAPYLADPYRLHYRQAQEILHLSMLRDHPFLFVFGTQWALVKSYGMASGTPLLVKTRQLCDPSRVGRRAEDTAVLVAELLVGDPDSERGRTALAKLNWLHGRYADEIKHGDYVHTLSLFVLEPQCWIDRFGWRPMTRLEKAAQLVYWREIGHRMGFGGIPETLEDLRVWKARYEDEHLYFVPENRLVADATVDLFLRGTPRLLHGAARSLFVSFIEEERVRRALGYPDPPPWATALTTGVLGLAAFAVRHLFLPRSRMLDPLPKPGPDGRLYREPRFVGFEPWYVADTWYNRLAMWLRSGGRMRPGGEFKSGGFLPEELGPPGFEKICAEPVREQARAMEEYVQKGGAAGVGCPFSFR